MDAIEMLESQHREVEALFSRIGKARDAAKKTALFEELADKLAMHAAIEEHHFYPAVKAKRTEDILLESLEEQVSHHVEEEETDLFPKVKKLFDKDQREAIGQEMSAEQAELEEKGDARDQVPSETDHPATI